MGYVGTTAVAATATSTATVSIMDIAMSGVQHGQQTAPVSSPMRFALRMQTLAAVAWLFRGEAAAQTRRLRRRWLVETEAEAEAEANSSVNVGASSYDSLGFLNCIEPLPWENRSAAGSSRTKLERCLGWFVLLLLSGIIMRSAISIYLNARRRARRRSGDVNDADEKSVKSDLLFFPRVEIFVLALMMIPLTLASVAYAIDIADGTLDSDPGGNFTSFMLALVVVAYLAGSCAISYRAMRGDISYVIEKDGTGRWMPSSGFSTSDHSNYVSRYGAQLAHVRGYIEHDDEYVELRSNLSPLYIVLEPAFLCAAVACCACGGGEGGSSSRRSTCAIIVAIIMALDLTVVCVLRPMITAMMNFCAAVASLGSFISFVMLAVYFRTNNKDLLPAIVAIHLTSVIGFGMVIQIFGTAKQLYHRYIVGRIKHTRESGEPEKEQLAETPEKEDQYDVHVKVTDNGSILTHVETKKSTTVLETQNGSRDAHHVVDTGLGCTPKQVSAYRGKEVDFFSGPLSEQSVDVVWLDEVAGRRRSTKKKKSREP
ncbi:hypothetical protein NFJ02_25g57930 [Pycnococcus provasolii]